MTSASRPLLSLIALGFAGTAEAQPSDFNLTYHVERTPAARLSIETCGNTVVQVSRRAGLTASAQRYPGQLVIVQGGRRGVGAFVVQCIATGGTTVTVVQGFDYRPAKGAMGAFADTTQAALRRAVR